MPLRDGKKFQPSNPPLDLRLDERVFQVHATGEVFRDYESFYKRSLLCKSLVWSCAYTGKGHLTFSEASKSEEDSRRQVESLPAPVKRAVLEVIHHCQRTSLWQLFEELWMLFKDRYWEEEQVEATVDKRRLKGKVVEVISPPRETLNKTPLSPPAVTPVNGVSPSVVTPPPLTVSPGSKPAVVVLDLPEMVAMDTGCLSSSREEEEVEAQNTASSSSSKPPATQKVHKKKVAKLPICEAAALDPSLYQYRVEVCDVSGTSVVELPGTSISRLRNAITREKLRLFVRFATYKQESSDKYPFLVKDNLVQEYQLGERPFAPGPAQGVSLTTPTKSPKKRSLSQSSLDSFLKAGQSSGTPQRKKKRLSLMLDKDSPRLKQQKTRSLTPKKPERKWSKEMLKKMLKRKGMTPKRKERLEGELKKIVEVEKEQRKAERDAERERTKEKRQKERERKREEEERQKEWWKPREDLLCDDSEPLPPPEPLPFRLPSHLFPDAVMVLEYLRLFGPLFDIQGSNVGGITYAKLEECLMEGDPSSTLFHLLRFLLLALFGTMEDEEEKEVGLDDVKVGAVAQQPLSVQGSLITDGETKGPANGGKGGEQGRDSPQSNGMATPAGQETPTGEDREDLRPVPSDSRERQAFSTAAAVFATSSLSSQGVPLRSIPLDFCTLPEVLRLHLLSSGQTKSSGDCRVFRYQRRGGYSQCDDPGIDFCLKNPQLLSKMSRVPVYDLLPEEKLMVVGVLCHQLLTYSVVRDALDETYASLKAARKQCRDIHYEIERLKRPTKKKKQKEPGKLEEGKENVDEGEEEEEEEGKGQRGGSGSAKKAKPAKRKPSISGKTKNKDNGAKEGAVSPTANKEGITEQMEEEEALPTGRIRELERELEAAVAEVVKFSVAINLQPLGLDRWHRVYWWFPSMPGLFVEQPPAKQVYLPTPVRAAAAASVIAAGPTYKPNHAPKPQWSMYPVDEEHFTGLLKALNQRGARESVLRKRLASQKDMIMISTEKLLRRREVKSEPALYDSAEDYMELTLRECLLEVEDNVYCGNLGHVRSKESRAEWRSMLEHSRTVAKYERRKTEAKGKRESGARAEGGMSAETMEVLVEPSGETSIQMCASTQSSRTQTPLPQSPECPTSGTASGVSSPLCNPTVKELAAAMLQIQEGVEKRFLKLPLGNAVEESAKSRQRRKIEAEKLREPCLQQWQASLRSCTSQSQLAIHWYTLERSIIWSKSLMNLRCRKCCKKGGDEYLLLCDGCDNGFHTYCLDPPLLEIPEGNWFCSKCKPASPVKLRRVSGMQRSASQETDEESSDDHLSEGESMESGEGPGRSRQKNRRNIPLPRRSTRIQKRRPQEDDSDQSEEESSESEESTDEEGSDDQLSGLQEKTERVLEELRSASRGTRAQNARMQQLHEALLDELMGHPDGWLFEKLPKKSEAPSYYKKVRNPMDLQTLKVKANTEGYLNGELFVSSVQQIFHNCQLYHPAESEEAECGRRLHEYFRGRLDELGLTPKKSGRSRKGKQRISSGDEGGGEETLPVPEKLLTKTWLAVNDLRECQHGTRQHKAKFSAVHECLLEELCVHPDSAPFLKLPSRRQEPQYYATVEDPVDLHGLKVTVKKDGFASHDQLVKQLRLIMSNTREYFGQRSTQARAANSLEEYLNERLKDLGLVSRRKQSRRGRKK